MSQLLIRTLLPSICLGSLSMRKTFLGMYGFDSRILFAAQSCSTRVNSILPTRPAAICSSAAYYIFVATFSSKTSYCKQRFLFTAVVPVPEVTSIIIEPSPEYMKMCFMKSKRGFWYEFRVTPSYLNFASSEKFGRQIFVDYLNKIGLC